MHSTNSSKGRSREKRVQEFLELDGLPLVSAPTRYVEQKGVKSPRLSWGAEHNGSSSLITCLSSRRNVGDLDWWVVHGPTVMLSAAVKRCCYCYRCERVAAGGVAAVAAVAAAAAAAFAVAGCSENFGSLCCLQGTLLVLRLAAASAFEREVRCWIYFGPLAGEVALHGSLRVVEGEDGCHPDQSFPHSLDLAQLACVLGLAVSALSLTPGQNGERARFRFGSQSQDNLAPGPGRLRLTDLCDSVSRLLPCQLRPRRLRHATIWIGPFPHVEETWHGSATWFG
mmetsp:Transcript_88424/g.184801  ORF Transcript_88424/g.184801 Transcript_88424/m.184801 type:complete len:283 (+) Transcript_88424:381-1229(+)